MLELIFQGFSEWLYGLVLEAWEYFASVILDVMSLDFAYLEGRIPIMTDMRQVLLAGGWALLIGNLVFQSIRGMVVGLGFEGEDPKLLFTRTFIFSFLLLASPQICDLCLNMTSMLVDALKVPSSVDVHLVDSSAFGSLSVSWLLIIIFNVIIMFQVFKLMIEVAERYVILGVLTMAAPLAFGVGGSKSTSDIFTGWCRMFGSMCLLMVSHIIFMKMLLSVLSAVPSGLDTFLWIILVLSIVKVAKKADSIITRIGLNPAFTGDALHAVPGALSYVLLRQATSQITKSLGKATGGSGRGRTPGSSPGGRGPRTGGPRGSGGPSGASYTYNNPSASGTSSTTSSPTSSTANSNVVASNVSPVSNTSSTLPLASAKDVSALPGDTAPFVPPGGGPITPNNPTSGSLDSHPSQPRIQPQNGQGVDRSPERKAGMTPYNPGQPGVTGKMPTAPASSSSTPQSGVPGLPGTAGTASVPVSGHDITPPMHPPTPQAVQQSAQTIQFNKEGHSPALAAGKQPEAVHLSHPVSTERSDPGSAVTTQKPSSEARFSRREKHTPGRASSMTLQSTHSAQAARESTPHSTEGTPSQTTRFTARPGLSNTHGGSGTPCSPGSDNTQKERISHSESKSVQQTTRQITKDTPTSIKPSSTPATRPAPSGRSAVESTTRQPGTAGMPPSSPEATPSLSSRQSRNKAPTSSKSSRILDDHGPAKQEVRLGSVTPASAAIPVPHPNPGTAGMGAPSIAPASGQTPRHGRNAVSGPAGAPSHGITPSPAQQESRITVPTQPAPTAPSVRSGLGTAGTASSPGRTASPVQSAPPSARSARPSGQVAPVQSAHSSGQTPPTRPTRPDGLTPTTTPPSVKQGSAVVKVTPAIKSPSAPTDTRYKKGYPAKSSKGGKKRHGR